MFVSKSLHDKQLQFVLQERYLVFESKNQHNGQRQERYLVFLSESLHDKQLQFVLRERYLVFVSESLHSGQ